MKRLLLICVLLGLAGGAFAQAPLLMPIPEQQFFTPTGAVCSGCFVYTYISGTYTPLATYTDYTGLVTNTNPVVLNSAGFPETSVGVQVGIWLQPVQTYRIVLQNAAHVQLYQVDGVTAPNGGVFTGGIVIEQATCNQIVFGVSPFTTSLCFPPPASSIVLTFPNGASDSVVTNTAAATLTNKSLTTPMVNNTEIVNSPGTYISNLANSSTGTTLNTLTKMVGSPAQAQIAATTDVVGVIGICVLTCGTTGNPTIQEDGYSTCVFDGPTTARDLVTISTTTAGDCHDTGSSTSSATGQPVGIIFTTNAGGGTYNFLLIPSVFSSSALGGIPGTPTLNAGWGTGATIGLATGSRDKAGEVTISVGTSPSGTAQFTVPFSTPFLTASWCVVTPENVQGAGFATYFASSSPSSLIVTFSGSPTAGQTLNYNYLCQGY